MSSEFCEQMKVHGSPSVVVSMLPEYLKAPRQLNLEKFIKGNQQENDGTNGFCSFLLNDESHVYEREVMLLITHYRYFIKAVNEDTLMDYWLMHDIIRSCTHLEDRLTRTINSVWDDSHLKLNRVHAQTNLHDHFRS